MARYAIGDVHGCLRTLEALLHQLAPGRGDQLIMLGDYVDRGPDSRGVIDLLMSLPAAGVELFALQGNHEVMLLEAQRAVHPQARDRWLRNGGQATLLSFGLNPADADARLPERYLHWIANLELMHCQGPWVCVHAGLDLSAEQPLEAGPETALWIRQWFDEARMASRLPGIRVLHGHTPIPRWVLEQAQGRGRQALDLDTGCVYADRDPDMGWLCAYALDSDTLHFARNRDC